MRRTLLLFLGISVICTVLSITTQFLSGFLALSTGGWSAGLFQVPYTNNPLNILLIPLTYISIFSSFIFFPIGAFIYAKLNKKTKIYHPKLGRFLIVLLLVMAFLFSPIGLSAGIFYDFLDQLPYKINAERDKLANCKVKNGFNNYSNADGWIREEYACVNGVRQGPYKKFALHAAGYHILNLQASAAKVGDILEEGSYKDGKQDGVIKQYTNMVVTSELTYKDGLLDGPYKIYDKNGQLIKVGEYNKVLYRKD